MLARINALSTDTAELETVIGEMIAPFADAVARLDEIPGIGPTAATLVIAEIGVDSTVSCGEPADKSSYGRLTSYYYFVKIQKPEAE